MARFTLNVLLFAFATGAGFAQSGTLTATAQGGFTYIGSKGEAMGSISGSIRLGVDKSAEMMLVLKDVGGATKVGENEAIVFLKSVEKSKSSGNTLVILGKGTFQGEARDIELTLIDATGKLTKDQFTVRVLRAGRVEFEHSAKVDSKTISISKKR